MKWYQRLAKMVRPLNLPQNEAEARTMLLDLAKKMFPKLEEKGLEPKEAADTIFKAWWEKVFDVGKPALEFYEKHIEPGLVEKVRNSPSQTKFLSQIKRDLLDIYQSNKGKDRFGKPLPKPDKWPWFPAWWRTWYKDSADLQKGNLEQLLTETFYVPIEQGKTRRLPRYDPIRIPKKREPASFDPAKPLPEEEPTTLVAKSP